MFDQYINKQNLTIFYKEEKQILPYPVSFASCPHVLPLVQYNEKV